MAAPTLKQRLEEIMAAKGWTRDDLMTHSGQSSSVVSQWLGNVGSSKTIHSIGKIEAAIGLERASGYSALWIAKGKGPKMAPSDSQWPFKLTTRGQYGDLSPHEIGVVEYGMLDALEKLGRSGTANNRRPERPRRKRAP
jgi:hypothetical protein